MANFGIRLAAPPPARRLTTPHGALDRVVAERPLGILARAISLVRRGARAALQALDDAPYDLAWPPSPRAAAVWAQRRAELQARSDGSTRER